MELVIAVVALVVIFVLLKKGKKNVSEVTENEYLGKYEKRYLLTKYEYGFYKELKPVADKLNLAVLAKVRVADIVSVKSGFERADYMKYFSKIKSKHIDFVLVDPTNMKVELLIELDDSSHNQNKTQERDNFINALYADVGYKCLRVPNSKELKNKIKAILEE